MFCLLIILSFNPKYFAHSSFLKSPLLIQYRKKYYTPGLDVPNIPASRARLDELVSQAPEYKSIHKSNDQYLNGTTKIVSQAPYKSIYLGTFDEVKKSNDKNLDGATINDVPDLVGHDSSPEKSSKDSPKGSSKSSFKVLNGSISGISHALPSTDEPLSKSNDKSLNGSVHSGASQTAYAFSKPATKEKSTYLQSHYKNPSTHTKDMASLNDSVAPTPKIDVTLRLNIISNDNPNFRYNHIHHTNELIDINPSLTLPQLRSAIKQFLTSLFTSSKPEARANLAKVVFTPDHEIKQVKASWSHVNLLGAGAKQDWEKKLSGGGEEEVVGSETIVTEENCGRVLGALKKRDGQMDGLIVEVSLRGDGQN